MGLFKRSKQNEEHPSSTSEPEFQPGPEGRRFRQALLDGEPEAAEAVLRAYMDGEPEHPDPLMAKAAIARMALDHEHWDDAAEALQDWGTGHPTDYLDNEAKFVECCATYIARGVGLTEFLSNPVTLSHPRYRELLDDTFVPIVNGVRLASQPNLHGTPPVPVRISFDPIYAQLKSAYELRQVK